MEYHYFKVQAVLKFFKNTDLDRNTQCRVWQGAVNTVNGKNGYGVIRLKFPGTASRTYSAHIYIYIYIYVCMYLCIMHACIYVYI